MLNFWNHLLIKIAISCSLKTPTANWQPNYTILTSSVKVILKAMIDTEFLRPSLGVVIIFTESAHWADLV